MNGSLPRPSIVLHNGGHYDNIYKGMHIRAAARYLTTRYLNWKTGQVLPVTGVAKFFLAKQTQGPTNLQTYTVGPISLKVR
jgi:hypothetical protein